MFEEVSVLTHSSIRISGRLTLYFDPYQIQNESRDADIILITHDHFDHFSPEDIRKIIKEDTVLVLPECMHNLNMREPDKGVPEDSVEYKYVAPEGVVEVKGLIIKAVPAYNRMKPFHPKSKRYVGYLVKMDEVTYYVAGDTDCTPENQAVKCDVALVPVGGKFTMNYKEAASLVNSIRPRLAIPTHYGSVAGDSDDGRKFAALVDSQIECRIMI